MVKFLIIRFSSIGDIVLTTPVIRCLKQQVEEAEVHYFTKKQFVPVLKANPYIDKIHILNDNFSESVGELRDEYFDYIIDLHKNIRTYRFISKLKLVTFAFDKLNWKKWLIVNLKINKLPDVHIVDRYLKTTQLFDVKNDDKGLDYFIPEGDELPKETLPLPFSNGYVALVIGAKHATKRMPTEKLTSICKQIKYPVLILGGKEDKAEGEAIKAAVGDSILNTCGDYSLNQSASLVRQATLVVAHDTGLMHIAAAFKKKILSIWGNTIPEFGMYPYLPHKASKILEIKDLKCRPCSKIGHKKCPKSHFECMNKIDETAIIEWIDQNFATTE